MKIIKWNEFKNDKIKRDRGISFEEIEFYLSSGHIIDITTNDKYPGQQIYVLNIDEYIYLVPFIETDNEIILITAFKSRKAKKKYLNNQEL